MTGQEILTVLAIADGALSLAEQFGLDTRSAMELILQQRQSGIAITAADVDAKRAERKKAEAEASAELDNLKNKINGV